MHRNLVIKYTKEYDFLKVFFIGNYFNLYSDVGKDGYKLHQMIIYSSDKAYIYLTISS